MKRANFTQADGFPFEEKTIDFMQSAYFEILNAVIGHFALPDVGNFIISGCEVVGNGITKGVVFIDGELCLFSGVNIGNGDTKIAKIETIEEGAFEGGNNLPTYYSYVAMENENGVKLSEFERVANVPELVNKTINWNEILGVPEVVIDPANLTATPPEKTVLQRLELLEKQNKVFQAGGGMVLWNKPAIDIPDGWAEVVNWKGRIPVGVDNRTLNGNFVNPEFSPLTSEQNDPGREGGQKQIELTMQNIPAHKFKYKKTTGGGAGVHVIDYQGVLGDNYMTWVDADTDTLGGLPDGTTKKLEVLSPFRTVLFIEFIG